MGSKIDSEAIVDGQPVSKDKIRRSLRAARDEMEHGGFFRIASNDSAERTVRERLSDYLSVRDFGAIGDGITDDSKAIFAALEAASASQHIVHFPSGHYRIGKWKVFRPSGPMFLSGEPGVILDGGGHDGFLEIDGVDLHLADLGFQNFATLVRFHDRSGSFSQCTLRNCQFRSVSKTLFKIDASKGGLESLNIEGCLFDGYFRAIQIQTGEVHRAIVRGNHFVNGGDDAFFVGKNNEIDVVPKRPLHYYRERLRGGYDGQD